MAHPRSKLRRSRYPGKSVTAGKWRCWSKSCHGISFKPQFAEGSANGYCRELATLENALFAFDPINRTVPTTRTRMTASITAYSAMSCPASSDHSLRTRFRHALLHTGFQFLRGKN